MIISKKVSTTRRKRKGLSTRTTRKKTTMRKKRKKVSTCTKLKMNSKRATVSTTRRMARIQWKQLLLPLASRISLKHQQEEEERQIFKLSLSASSSPPRLEAGERPKK